MNSPAETEGPILAIDPGKDKCGVAVVGMDGKALHREIVPSRGIAEAASRLVDEYRATRLVVGDRTAAKEVCRALAARVQLTPQMVDEHRSSEQARRRFFQENPPRGWRRLLPVTLLSPGRPYDDLVAVLLAERYLASRE